MGDLRAQSEQAQGVPRITYAKNEGSVKKKDGGDMIQEHTG